MCDTVHEMNWKNLQAQKNGRHVFKKAKKAEKNKHSHIVFPLSQQYQTFNRSVSTVVMRALQIANLVDSVGSFVRQPVLDH